MRPVIQTRAILAADTDAIALAQALGGAGNLTLNGTLVSAGVAQIGNQQRVTLTSAGNLSALTFTITGTRQDGQAVSQTLTGPNVSTVTTTLDFATVTQIAVSGAMGANVEAGVAGVGASSPVPLDQYVSPFNVSLGIEITGTVNVTAQYTFSDIFNTAPSTWVWFDHPDLTGVTAASDGTFISPVTACRLLTNSGVGTAVLRILQAGAT